MAPLIAHHFSKICELLRQHGVERAYLFGSAARDAMAPQSDVDIVIRFPSDMRYTAYADNYFLLAEALEELLKKPVDLITEPSLKNPWLIRHINQSKIQLI